MLLLSPFLIRLYICSTIDGVEGIDGPLLLAIR